MALRSGGTLYWLLSDHLGSTAVTLSGTTEAGEVCSQAFGASRFTFGLALAADVGGLLLPGLTGGGLLVRAAAHADDVAAGALHAAAHADDAADAARAAAQGGATTHFYRFGADIIGVRRSDQGTQYLFSDHLGSVSAATTASGALVGMQHYDPWGRVRTGGIGLTARNFTGQRLDATGLLYYHARYYDPTLGRFIAPDSLVPEPGAPQSLNRYAYVYNNPLKYTDPTGHWIERAVDIAFIAYDIWDIPQNGLTWDNGLALAADVGGLLLPGLTGGGLLVRAATHADDVAAGALHAAAHADDAADAARAATQGGAAAADAARAAAQGGEAADAARSGQKAAEAAVHGAGQPHKNANHAVSHFGIYEIKVNGETYKFGKADLDRVTQSSGLPTRVHQQVRRLSKTYDDVRPEIVDLGYITTQQAKQAERAALQRYYETTRRIPPGNQKSFRPD